MSRYRFGRRRVRPGAVAAALAAVLVIGAGSVHAGHSRAPGRAARAAIAFARAQLGCPYVWGGTGPCAGGFDCSGLVMEAYASAGVSIPRTSQQQWADLRHVSQPEAGYLVFFAGGDGTTAAPGHVGLVISPRRHLMIEAYAPGVPVRVSHYGTASAASGDGDPVGYARPGGK